MKKRLFTFDEYMAKYKSKNTGDKKSLGYDPEKVASKMAKRSLSILRAALKGLSR